MFCFITSLRAPQASANWPRVCELFERTAASVFAQTESNFRLIVAGHAPPILRRQFDARLEFIAADLPVPNEDYYLRGADKRDKLIVGLRQARALGAHAVMAIDADDLVSCRLAEFVLARPEIDGWHVARGFKHAYGRGWIEPIEAGFNLLCGSCNVLSRRWFAFPGDRAREAAAERAWFDAGHDEFARVFGALGARIEPVPFPAAVYIANASDGLSNSDPDARATRPPRSGPRRLAGRALLALRTIARRRPLTNKLRDEFSIAGPLAS